MVAGWRDKRYLKLTYQLYYGNTKKIGAIVHASPKSLSDRRHDLKVIVPVKNDFRKVEAFDATPVLNAAEDIIAESNSTFDFLRLARIVLETDRSVARILKKEEAVYYVNKGKAIITAEGHIV